MTHDLHVRTRMSEALVLSFDGPRPRASRPHWKGDHGKPIRMVWLDPLTGDLIDPTGHDAYLNLVDPAGVPTSLLASIESNGVFEWTPGPSHLATAGIWKARALLLDSATSLLARISHPAELHVLEPIPVVASLLGAPPGAPLFNLAANPQTVFPDVVLAGAIPAAFHTDMEFWFRTIIGHDQTDTATRYVYYYGSANRLYEFGSTFRLRADSINHDIAKPATFNPGDVFDFICTVGGDFQVWHNAVLIGSVPLAGSHVVHAAFSLDVGATGASSLWAGQIYSPVPPGVP